MMSSDALTRWFAPLRRMFASSAMRLAVTVSVLFTLATILAGGISYWLQTHELQARLTADAQQIATSLASTYETGGRKDLMEQIASSVSSARDFANLYLFVPEQGQPTYGNASIVQPFTGSKYLAVGVDVFPIGNAGALDGEGYLAFGIKIQDGWIIIGRDTQWVTDSQEVMVQSIAWGLGISLLMSVCLALIIAHRSEARIVRLSDVLGGAASGDLTLRYADPSGTSDDISRVAHLVNGMLDRLSVSMDSLRQVSTDVAHDLRSPLTRLRTRLEPHAISTELPHETRMDLQKALNDLDTIVSTFDAVLRLARIEGGNATPEIEEVDVGQLSEAMLDMLQPVAADMGHSLSVSKTESRLLVAGDRDMLSQAIVNVVENAFRHCPAPADIRLFAWREGAEVCLRICDDGPGIPPTQREAVLRRFYRLESSRSTLGSGLGLTLVAAIIRLHNGILALSDNDPGLYVEFRLSALS